ncbi:hypothetical protein C7R94_06210 [Brevibacillus sp. NRRL NRS-603]|nr:hypothetical protein C7R94_06210 [Brevibacillus sp. NRRL NRS-603]
MSSSRLYPLFVRAVSFQTCDSAFVQLMCSRSFYNIFVSNSRGLQEFTLKNKNKKLRRRSAFPVQAPLEPDPA